MLSPEQEYAHYQAYVAALFTAPFLREEQLLANLTAYWPGDAAETLSELVAVGLVEVAPTGRYRLPLPAGILSLPSGEPVPIAKPQPTVVDQAAPHPQPPIKTSAAVPARASREAPQPQFKPLRLMIATVASTR
ncbi:hypothetical protein [Hymenobacter sp. YC55]|uniref:hypothetical protein n=1 Tax=Hymenobacter sp. YC55 TaxID=3034019 RepID=UPI0023F83848|nr:hypothetical protein [Hymenobacter sp. YC55]MDF7810926.1 hypothetical protein [Hymenobacter sp. YC55]